MGYWGRGQVHEGEVAPVLRAWRPGSALRRLPGDFMFELTDVEASASGSRVVILKDARRTHRK